MTMIAGNSLDDGFMNQGGEGDQYLTFILAGEEYGLDILRVQEIRGWTSTTPIPNSPVYVKGVINLRGTIVPIIDLRQRFDMALLEYGATTVVIVVRVVGEHKERIMGIVVDAVSEVYTLETGKCQQPPDMGMAMGEQFISGLTTVDEKMIILLDLDKLLNLDIP